MSALYDFTDPKLAPTRGRMDRHEPHEWILRAHAGYATTIYDCPGTIAIEGGAECVTCQQPIANCEHSWRGQMRRWSE